MTVYIGLLRKDHDSDFGIDFPDFPGCVTAGSSIDEALAMASEALEGHISAMQAEGYEVPEPSDLAPILADPENRGAVPILVPVDMPDRPVRVNVMVPGKDLRAIDSFAKRHGMSRSGFLVTAARKAISADEPATGRRRPRGDGSAPGKTTRSRRAG